MRTRSRSVFQKKGSGSITHTSINNVTGEKQIFTENFSVDGSCFARIEAMSDEISKKPRHIGARAPRDRLGYRIPIGHTIKRYPNHECVHSKKSIKYFNQEIQYGSSTLGDWTTAHEASFQGASYAEHVGISTLGDPLHFFEGTSPSYSTGPLGSPDWFHLLDRFGEACDSLLPSSFLLGEDMAESDIFKDALLTVLRPKHAMRTFVKRIREHAPHLLHKKLGYVAAYAAKNAANLNLSYNFGVKPAIHDIRDALSAHKKVEDHLKYLRGNVDRWVPIRVKQDIAVPITNFEIVYPNSSMDVWKHLDAHFKRATISSWGKIRNNLNLASKWRAYAEYFGITHVVGLAWELIPFSFCADWITNAQERINSLTRIRLPSPYTEIRDLSASLTEVKVETLYAPSGHYDSAFNLHQVKPDAPYPIMSVRTSLYERFNSVPSTSGLIDLSSLGLFQFISSGALVLQRI